MISRRAVIRRTSGAQAPRRGMEESMGDMINLTAEDGHKLSAYKATPSGKPRGALVVIQEIFGVNHHIKSVTDRFGKEGYLSIAPALFDRVERVLRRGRGRCGGGEAEVSGDLPLGRDGCVDPQGTLGEGQAAAPESDTVRLSGRAWLPL